MTQHDIEYQGDTEMSEVADPVSSSSMKMKQRETNQSRYEEASSVVQWTPGAPCRLLQPPTLLSTPWRPANIAPAPPQPSIGEPGRATTRCYGMVTTVTTTPPSLVIIPDVYGHDYDLAAGISRERLVAFLHRFAKDEWRVSYVLRPSGEDGMMMAEDVRSSR